MDSLRRLLAPKFALGEAGFLGVPFQVHLNLKIQTPKIIINDKISQLGLPPRRNSPAAYQNHAQCRVHGNSLAEDHRGEYSNLSKRLLLVLTPPRHSSIMGMRRRWEEPERRRASIEASIVACREYGVYLRQCSRRVEVLLNRV